MKVLITGGSGHLGREMARQFTRRGDEIRILSRRPASNETAEWVRGDLSTGAGVADAVAGVDAIVHAATLSPAAIRGGFRPVDFFHTPSEVDVAGTRQLLEVAEHESVAHILHVSIVGIDDSRLPYMRTKLAAEQIVSEGRVPWSIVRATGFYWLMARLLANMEKMPAWVLPRHLDSQPCDSDDCASYLVDCLAEGPGGMRREFAGPEVIDLRQLARQFQEARGKKRPILPVPLPQSALRSAISLPVGEPVLGTTTWHQWLDRNPAEANVRPTTDFHNQKVK